MSIPCDKTFLLVTSSRSSVKVKVKYQGHHEIFQSFQDGKILDESDFKAFADDKKCTSLVCLWKGGKCMIIGEVIVTLF